MIRSHKKQQFFDEHLSYGIKHPRKKIIKNPSLRGINKIARTIPKDGFIGRKLCEIKKSTKL